MVGKKKKSNFNKRVFAQVLILTLALSIWVFAKLMPDNNLAEGKKAYQNKDYKTAYVKLKKAVALSPKNYEARYYYIQTLTNLKPTLDVQKETYYLTQNDLADSADLFADRQIEKWRTQIKEASGNTYIEQVPLEKGILRWDVKKFPLKVYIKNNSTVAPTYYEGMIRKAFLQWQAETNNFIKFDFTNYEDNSNIDVNIKSSADMKKCTEENCKYAVAYTTPEVSGNTLKKMNMYFYDSNNLGQPFSEREIYNTALHEIGHSLGIMGHSPNKEDLMYMASNKNNIEYDINSDNQIISLTDLNTISLLYKLTPDITNTPLNQFDTTGQFFAPIVMGNNTEINSRKITEAQNYIKAAPEIPNGYIDLASAYAETKQYNLAIKTLEKALSLCSNDNEKFIVYYNTAVIYMNIKDYPDAIKNAEIAKTLNASSDLDGLIAMANFKLGKNNIAKKAYIEAIAKNPDNIINSYNLATIYMREYNFAQAGKILNKLVQASPEARNDTRIKRYSLIMFFFH